MASNKNYKNYSEIVFLWEIRKHLRMCFYFIPLFNNQGKVFFDNIYCVNILCGQTLLYNQKLILIINLNSDLLILSSFPR